MTHFTPDEKVRASRPRLSSVIKDPLAVTRAGKVVVFTPLQLRFIARKAAGINDRMGSTHSEVTRKIRIATGWDGSGVALFFRFAVTHKLVTL